MDMRRSRWLRPRARFAAASCVVSGAFTVLLVADCTAQWKPTRNVEIVVPTSAGTGGDRTARFIQHLLTAGKDVDAPITVVNKPGGAANLGLVYLLQHAANGHYIMMNTAALITNHITGKSRFKHTDVTPLAQMGTDAIGFAVRADAPYASARELGERLRADPASVTVAFANALGNQNHIAAAMVARSVGAAAKQMKVVVFNGSGEAVTAMLGGHVDVVVSSASSLQPHARAGRARLLAISAEQRHGGALAAVPTWKEHGISAVFSNVRTLVGPGGLPEEQVRFWDAVFARLAQAPEWKAEMERQLIEPTYLNAADTRRQVEREYAEIAAILADLGLATSAVSGSR